MKELKLNYNQAHNWVNKHQNARWNGWDIEFFSPAAKARYDPQGIRFNGRWGFINIIKCNDEGMWLLDSESI